MKKGCFISVILFLTLILVATFYIFKYYNDDITHFGKTKVLELTKTRLISGLNELDDKQYVDSLKYSIDKYLAKMEEDSLSKNYSNIKKLEELVDNFDVILLDKHISLAEYKFITKQLNKNDKRKKN
ncbi:MAG: hypothetical protein V3V16_04295 [Melioribacteraceae bacterium]